VRRRVPKVRTGVHAGLVLSAPTQSCVRRVGGASGATAGQRQRDLGAEAGARAGRTVEDEGAGQSGDELLVLQSCVALSP
jgi:hypothetical protein